MLKNLMMGAAAVALSVGAVSGAANATVFKFVADLSSANEVGSPPLLTGSGTGVMFYDDNDTILDTSDDTYRLRVEFSGLGMLDNPSTTVDESGSTLQTTEVHNHLGVRGTNGSVIMHLDGADDVEPDNETPLDTGLFALVSPILVGNPNASLLALDSLSEQGTPITPGVNLGEAIYGEDDIIRNLLAYAYGDNDDSRPLNPDGTLDTNWYINLHTSFSDGDEFIGTGHIRDQWRLAAAVPEPASMTLLGAGIMGLGYFGKRRKA